MKIYKEKINTVLYIIVCFILVIGTAKLLVFARDNFEKDLKVRAETLTTLPLEIKQNQLRYLIEDGYLTATTFLTGIDK
jgi:hypothetical protein